MGSPSVAMVNGQAWVWVVSEGGSLLAWNGAGQLQWQTCVSDQPCNATLGTFGGVAIADVNNDGRLDAVVQAEQHLRVLDALTGAIETTVRSRYPRHLFAVVRHADRRQCRRSDADRPGRRRRRQRQLAASTAATTSSSRSGRQAPRSAPRRGRRSSRTWPARAVRFRREPPATASATPSERLCFAVSGSPGDAAVVNLTPVEADRRGYGLLVSSDVARTGRIQRQLRARHRRPQRRRRPDRQRRQGLLRQLAARLCRTSSPTTSEPSAPTPTSPPSRAAPPTARSTPASASAEDRIPPVGRLCFAVSGSPGDAAVVNLTPVEADGPGYGLLVSSDVARTARIQRQLRHRHRSTPTSPSPRSAATARSASSTRRSPRSTSSPTTSERSAAAPTCPPSRAAHPTARSTPASASAEDRIPPVGRLCFAVSGSPGDAAVVNLTPVEADSRRLRTARLVRRRRHRSHPTSTTRSARSTPTSPSPRSAATARCASSTRHLPRSTSSPTTSEPSAPTPTSPPYPSGAPDRKVDTRSGLG